MSGAEDCIPREAAENERERPRSIGGDKTWCSSLRFGWGWISPRSTVAVGDDGTCVRPGERERERKRGIVDSDWVGEGG